MKMLFLLDKIQHAILIEFMLVISSVHIFLLPFSAFRISPYSLFLIKWYQDLNSTVFSYYRKYNDVLCALWNESILNFSYFKTSVKCIISLLAPWGDSANHSRGNERRSLFIICQIMGRQRKNKLWLRKYIHRFMIYKILIQNIFKCKISFFSKLQMTVDFFFKLYILGFVLFRSSIFKITSQ